MVRITLAVGSSTVPVSFGVESGVVIESTVTFGAVVSSSTSVTMKLIV